MRTHAVDNHFIGAIRTIVRARAVLRACNAGIAGGAKISRAGLLTRALPTGAIAGLGCRTTVRVLAVQMRPIARIVRACHRVGTPRGTRRICRDHFINTIP